MALGTPCFGQLEYEWSDGGAPGRFVAFQSDGNLGEPSFDPYGNSGAPNPPEFGGDSVGNPPDKPWFGQPYTAPKDPPSGSVSGRLFGADKTTRFSDLLR